ncbi:MAG: hypothetical protein IH624_18955 [Phycisphaerae bacterium]|nr:hypothetical protein [Phycisphaerae bacterium]
MIHAFISDGRLHLRGSDGTSREIESRFVREKIDSAEQHRAHSGWKNSNCEDGSCWNRSVVWGSQSSSPSAAAFRFRDVIAVDANTLYYTVTNNVITGLFKYDIAEDEELRLFHRNGFKEAGMGFSQARTEFVMGVIDEDGKAGIQLLDERGGCKRRLTAGDSMDINPVFSRTDTNRVLFQSAGIARDEEGFMIAYGPSAICSLDTENDQMADILADDRYDYLLPRDDAEGNIYCIRRPYKSFGYVPLWRTALHVAAFPVRLLVAIVNFLNMFAELFSRNPLRPMGPQVRPAAHNKYVRVLGETIDLAKIRRRGGSEDKLSLVPGSWELIRLTPDGRIETVARHAAGYDIDAQGHVHYTNGYTVSRVADARTAVSFRHPVIEKMTVTI